MHLDFAFAGKGKRNLFRFFCSCLESNVNVIVFKALVNLYHVRKSAGLSLPLYHKDISRGIGFSWLRSTLLHEAREIHHTDYCTPNVQGNASGSICERATELAKRLLGLFLLVNAAASKRACDVLVNL